MDRPRKARARREKREEEVLLKSAKYGPRGELRNKERTEARFECERPRTRRTKSHRRTLSQLSPGKGKRRRISEGRVTQRRKKKTREAGGKGNSPGREPFGVRSTGPEGQRRPPSVRRDDKPLRGGKTPRSCFGEKEDSQKTRPTTIGRITQTRDG